MVVNRLSQLKIGTRGSPLAMVQARMVADALARGHGAPASIAPADITLVPIETKGDKVQDRALAEIGGKALWTKELDRALFDRRIDLAVHSMKDVETSLPPGIALAAVLPRADPRDRLIGAASLAALPPGAVIGTASPRRAAMTKNRRPDLGVAILRGNVETRLRRVREGRVQATFLAAAGLERLGIDVGIAMPIDSWLPAPAQGIIGVTCRAGDARVRALLAALSDEPTFTRLRAERAVLRGIGGDCHTSVAVHATLAPGAADAGGDLRLRAELLSPDGRDHVRVDLAAGPGEGPEELGARVAEALMAGASAAIRASLAPGNPG